MARSRLGVAGRGLAGGGGADVALRPLAAGQRHGLRDGAGGPFEPGGGVLSQNWYYSTELRVFCQQLLFKLGLLVFPGSWHAARMLAQGLLSALLAGSYLFFARGAGFGKAPPGRQGAAVPLRLLAALPRGDGRLLLCAHDLCAGEPGPCGAAGASGLAPSHRPHGGGAGAGELCRRPQRGAAADEPLCAAGGGCALLLLLRFCRRPWARTGRSGPRCGPLPPPCWPAPARWRAI